MQTSTEQLFPSAHSNENILNSPTLESKLLLPNPSESLLELLLPPPAKPNLFSRLRQKTSPLSIDYIYSELKSLLPILNWVPKYEKSFFLSDLIAGLTISVMTIPQGMAYATLAGLDPVYGLYAALVPFYVYAIFGQTPQIVMGMVAVNALIISSSLTQIVDRNLPSDVYKQRYTDLALFCSMITGLLSIIMGFFRLGYVVTFISPSVITGFTSGCSLVIALSQLEAMLGLKVEKSSWSLIQLANIFGSIRDTKWLTVVNGIAALLGIFGMKKISKKIPHSLIITIVTTGVSAAIHKTADLGKLLPVVGFVPSGLPSFYIPTTVYNTNDFVTLLYPSFLLTIIGFMQTIAISILFQSEKGDKVQPNKELFSLGMVHVLGAMFQSPDTTAGFSRSAVNVESGSKSQLSNCIAATVIIIALVGLTPLFYYIPKSTLGAIVIVAVLPLIDLKQYILMYKHKPSDAFVASVTFLLIVLSSIEIGLAVGILISILAIMVKSSRPHSCVMGKIDTKLGPIYRNVDRYQQAEQISGVLIWRFDADLWFGNVDHWRDSILELLKTRKSVQFLILDCASVNEIDLSGAKAIQKMVKLAYSLYKVRIIFTAVKGPVRDTLWLVCGGISSSRAVKDANSMELSNLDSDQALPGGEIVLEMFFLSVSCAVYYCKKTLESSQE